MTTRVDHLDESAHHHLASGEVGDDAVTQRTHGLDAVVGLLVHALGTLTNGYHLIGIAIDRYDGGLVNDNLITLDDDSIGGTEVHRYFLNERKESHLDN